MLHTLTTNSPSTGRGPVGGGPTHHRDRPHRMPRGAGRGAAAPADTRPNPVWCWAIAPSPGMTRAWVNLLPAETLGQLVVHGGFVLDDGCIGRLQQRACRLGFPDRPSAARRSARRLNRSVSSVPSLANSSPAI